MDVQDALKEIVREVLHAAKASASMIDKCVDKVDRSPDVATAIKSIGKAVKLFVSEKVARELVARMRTAAGV